MSEAAFGLSDEQHGITQIILIGYYIFSIKYDNQEIREMQ